MSKRDLSKAAILNVTQSYILNLSIKKINVHNLIFKNDSNITLLIRQKLNYKRNWDNILPFAMFSSIIIHSNQFNILIRVSLNS